MRLLKKKNVFSENGYTLSETGTYMLELQAEEKSRGASRGSKQWEGRGSDRGGVQIEEGSRQGRDPLSRQEMDTSRGSRQSMGPSRGEVQAEVARRGLDRGEVK